MTTYTSSLRMILPDSGALVNTWGTVLNASLINLIDSSIAGYTSITMSDADYTLTTANGSGDQARSAFLNFTGTNTAIRNVLAPAVSKEYVVSNNTTGGFSIVIKISGGTGVTVPNGQTMKVWSDGVNFYEAVRYLGAPYVGSLNASGNVVVGGTTTTGGIINSGNITGASNSFAYNISGGGVYNNGGGIALYGSSAAGSPGTISFFTGTGTTNSQVGSFNASGTFNVVNNATIGGTLGVGSTTTSTQFFATASGGGGQFSAQNGSTGGFIRNDGTNVYILKSNSSATGYDSSRPFTVNLSTGAVTLDQTGIGGTNIGGALSVTGNTALTYLSASTGITNGQAYVMNANNGSNYSYNFQIGNGATSKYLRVNSSSSLEVLNNAYNSVVATLSDAGALSVASTVTASQFNGSGAGLTGNATSLTVNSAGTAIYATTLTGGGTVNATTGTFTGALSAASITGSAVASAAQVLAGSSSTQAIVPAAFAANSSLTTNGYYKLPGGLILQWGSGTTPSSGAGSVSFPVSFNSAVFFAVVNVEYGGAANAPGVYGISTSGFSFFNPFGSTAFLWHAIGI